MKKNSSHPAPQPSGRQKMTMELRRIGHIETPYTAIKDCPRNIDPQGPLCTLVVHPDYAEAMLGLEPGMEILILYWLGEGDRDRLRQNSRKTGTYSGVFALRTPNRPNPVGAAVLPIASIDGAKIAVRGLDCLSGTVLLDIKPALEQEMAGE